MAKVHLSEFRPSNFLESNILFDWLSLLGEAKQVHCKQWDTFASKHRQAILDKVWPPGYSLILGHICLSSCRRAKQTVSTYGSRALLVLRVCLLSMNIIVCIHGGTPCYKQFLPGLEGPEKSADAENSEILR